MATRVHFCKMHGAGNDYIYVNTMSSPLTDPSAAALAWSDRHKGVGSDGLVLIGSSPVDGADFSMRIFNADGSEAMMCGNASRCVGKYLFEKGITSKRHILLHTKSGIKTLDLQLKGGCVERVTVDMLVPALSCPDQFIASAGLPKGVFVSMGNPHYVIFTDCVDEVETQGRWLECHPSFPQRCNIEFACLQAPDVLRVRVWERGSGITMACGTGACATAVAAHVTGRTGRKVVVKMDGGDLDIEWRENDGHVYMTGPAAFVYEGDILLPAQ